MNTLLAVTTSIGIVSKCFPGTNTLAYFTRFSMIKTKKFYKIFCHICFGKISLKMLARDKHINYQGILTEGEAQYS